MTVGNLIEKGIPFILLPILTRLLSQADYGAITTINAIRSTLEPVVLMSVSSAVGRAYYDRNKPEFDFKAYIFNALIVSTVLFMLVLITLGAARSIFLYLQQFAFSWLFLVTVYVWASAAGGIKVNLWIFQNRALYFSLFNIAKAIANLGLSLAIVFLWMRNWQGRVLGIGVVEIAFGFFALIFLIKQDGLRLKPDAGYLKDLLKFGMPLLPHSFGLIALSTADKYFLNAMQGLSVTGLYGVGYTIGMALIILTTPIDQALEPVIYENLSQLNISNARRLVRISYCYIAIVVMGALALWMVAPLALRLFVDEKFYSAKDYVFWIALGYGFLGIRRLFSKFITFSKKTHYITATTLIAGATAIVTNYVFVSLNGAMGAAQAVFISYGVYCLSSWWVVAKLYPLPWFSFFKSIASKVDRVDMTL